MSSSSSYCQFRNTRTSGCSVPSRLWEVKMARHCRFPVSRILSSVVIVLTFCNLGLSRTARAQSISNQSPPTPVSSGSGLQGQAPATFLVAPAVAVSGAPGSVAAGDLNGDGKLDLVVANFDVGKISVLLGQGNGQFATAVDYPVGKQPAFVLLADVNGDGKLDVVVCNEADGTLSVLLGNGDGTLQNPATYKTVSDPVYVIMGDFNGDGKPDLAVAGNASKTVAVLLNDGTGNFSKSVPYNIGRGPRSLTVADFDGDGYLDLASANADGTVSIMLGRGDGSFRAISSLSVASSPLSSVVSGDFNGDGKPDLTVTQAGTKLITVLLGRGDGTFQTGTPYTVGSNPAFVIATDVNNDNITDLVTANQSGNTFSVLLGNGDGTFKPSMDFVAGNSPRALATGDFNGDGHPDLAIVNFSDHTISFPLGNGDGTFRAARAYNVDLDRKSVAAGDLDGDGKPDLVVTNFCGTDATCASNGTVSVLLGVGDGTYKFAASYPLGAGPLSVALADLNGDQKLDLIAVNRGDKSVSVLLGNGDGTFQSALTYPAGNGPISVAVGDFNKDGKPDLAIAGDCGLSTCSQPGNVSVLLGNGDGSFQSAATYAVGYSPSSIVAGDVNGDGKLDLAVANACGKDSSCQSHGTATVLIGDGKGAFTSSGDVQLGNSPSALTLGDLNGDGALDLVAAYRADNKVGVLLGNGDGTFKTQVTYQVGTAPSAVVVADFNGDGKRDVAVANFKDSKVSVLFGNGDGTLQTAVHYPVGVGPESLVAIDPSNSGHADLVSANGNGGAKPMGSDVTVLKNIGPNAGTVPPASVVVANASGIPKSTYGDSVTFMATVTGDGISPIHTPSGTVVFEDNGVAIPDPKCNSANNVKPTADPNISTAVCTTTILAAAPSGTPIVASYGGDSYYAALDSSAITQTINPADAVIMVTPYSVTYDGNPHTAAGTAKGVKGEDLSADLDLSKTTHTNVADYPTDPWTFHDPNGNYKDANGTVHDKISKATPVFSPLQSNNPNATLGQPITFTATLTGVSGYPQPTGNVVFTDTYMGTPTVICTSALTQNGTTNSTATCSTPPPQLLGGSHTIVATYTGDANYGPADPSAPLAQPVVPATPVFSPLQSNNPNATFGQPITFTSTLTGVPGYPQPTGNVVFTDTYMGTPTVICTSALTQNGTTNSTAICSTPPPVLMGGSHSIVATYTDNTNYGPANPSPALPQPVVPATPVFSQLQSNNQNATFGQPITFTATLTGVPGYPQPTGNVVFTDTYMGTPTVICTSALTQNGTTNSTAICSTPPPVLMRGSHSIVATYTDNTNYGPAAPSPALPQPVVPATPVFSQLQSNNQNATLGQPITFTATLTGVSGYPQPTGNVVFTDTYMGTPTVICTSALTQNGTTNSTATCSTPPPQLLGGSHSIVATYTDNANYGPANPSPALVQPVGKATPVFSPLQSNNPNATFGQPITFTATLTGVPGYPQPTGNVVFTDTYMGTPTVICTSALTQNGTTNSTAICSTPPPVLMGGTHSIVATYTDNTNYGPAAPSPALPQPVVPATPVFSQLQSNNQNATLGQPITFTATLTGVSGYPQPTGNVVFTDTYMGTPTVICTSALTQNGTTNSTATCSTPPPQLLGGSHSIVATYTDNANYGPANPSPALVQPVGKATPVFSPLQSNNPNATFGQPITFTATLTGVPGYPQPTGNVVFTDTYMGTPTVICTSALTQNGTTNSTATCSTPPPVLMGGSHSIVATYTDNTNYGPANPSPALVQPVGKATPVFSPLQSNNPNATFGQPITFTATLTGVSGYPQPTGNVVFTDTYMGTPTVICTSALTQNGTTNSTATCSTPPP